MHVTVWLILLIPTAVHSCQSVATLWHFNPKPPAAQMMSVRTSQDKKSTFAVQGSPLQQRPEDWGIIDNPLHGWGPVVMSDLQWWKHDRSLTAPPVLRIFLPFLSFPCARVSSLSRCTHTKRDLGSRRWASGTAASDAARAIRAATWSWEKLNSTQTSSGGSQLRADPFDTGRGVRRAWASRLLSSGVALTTTSCKQSGGQTQAAFSSHLC